MGLINLDHINISTARLDETVAFFTDVLGLTVGDRPDFPFPGAWLYLNGRAVVHLVGYAVGRSPSMEAGLDHFALLADGYPDMLARLEKNGCEFRAIGVPGRITQQIFVLDPNGVTVELNFPNGFA
ncbi:VOC family protein [soil metagenome]